MVVLDNRVRRDLSNAEPDLILSGRLATKVKIGGTSLLIRVFEHITRVEAGLCRDYTPNSIQMESSH